MSSDTETTGPIPVLAADGFLPDVNPVIQVIDAGHFERGTFPSGKCHVEGVAWPCSTIIKAQEAQRARGWKPIKERFGDAPMFAPPKPAGR
jgi:hypothetical protein